MGKRLPKKGWFDYGQLLRHFGLKLNQRDPRLVAVRKAIPHVDMEDWLKTLNSRDPKLNKLYANLRELEDAMELELFKRFFEQAMDRKKHCYKPLYVKAVRKLCNDLTKYGHLQCSAIWAELAKLPDESMMRLFFPLFPYAWD
jgi:hypothetical protein